MIVKGKIDVNPVAIAYNMYLDSFRHIHSRCTQINTLQRRYRYYICDQSQIANQQTREFAKQILKCFVEKSFDIPDLFAVFKHNQTSQLIFEFLGFEKILNGLLSEHIIAEEQNPGFNVGMSMIIRNLKRGVNHNDTMAIQQKDERLQYFFAIERFVKTNQMMCVDSNFNLCQSFISLLNNSYIHNWLLTMPQLCENVYLCLNKQLLLCAKMMIYRTSQFADHYFGAIHGTYAELMYKLGNYHTNHNETVTIIRRITQQWQSSWNAISFLLHDAITSIIADTVDEDDMVRFIVLIYSYYLFCQTNQLISMSTESKSAIGNNKHFTTMVASVQLTNTFIKFLSESHAALRILVNLNEDKPCKYLHFLLKQNTPIPIDIKIHIVVKLCRGECERIHNKQNRKNKNSCDSDDDSPVIRLNRIKSDGVSCDNKRKELEMKREEKSNNENSNNSNNSNNIGNNETMIEFIMQQINSCTAMQIHNGLEVKYDDEKGIGEGPMREMLNLLSEEIFDKRIFQLFEYSPDGKYWHVCCKDSVPNDIGCDTLLFYQFVGKLLAMCLLCDCPLGVKLSNGILKSMLGQTVDWQDLKYYDFTMFLHFESWFKNNTTNDDLTAIRFVIYDKQTKSEIPLKDNGENIIVNNENRDEYCKLYAQKRLCHCKNCESKLSAIATGFTSILPLTIINHVLSIHELRFGIQGIDVINVDELRECVIYMGISENSDIISWFWQYFALLSQRKKNCCCCFGRAVNDRRYVDLLNITKQIINVLQSQI